MLEMKDIHKSYGPIHANRGIDLAVPAGRIVGLLGENGSGKSTLMKVLLGAVRADAGSIRFKGRTLAGHTPRDAIAAGIGMIYQHVMLVDAMTAADNIILGWSGIGPLLNRQAIAALVRETSAAHGLDVDPDAVVGHLSHGQRQRVEITKVLMRGVDLLVLDEPTSNLSAPEIERLLTLMQQLRTQGKSVVFISHKLGEILEVCDEVVVLRDGAVVGRSATAGIGRDELAHMMVGRDITAPLKRAASAPGAELLRAEGLALRDEAGIDRLSGIDLSLRAGEILAVAGIDGNGQRELAEVLTGSRHPDRGRVLLEGRDITSAPVGERIRAGIAYVPVDRATTSLVPAMSVEDNLALRDIDRPPLSCRGWIDRAAVRVRARARMERFGVRAAGPQAPARTLSGGNQQKIVVAREIGRSPRVLVAIQPTWGLDPGAARFVTEEILALRDAGGAVLFVSTELEEVLALGDRITVIHDGRLTEPVPRATADITAIGLAMAGAQR